MLGAGLALTLAVALCWPAAMRNASASGEKRTLSLFNIHTKESLTVAFKTDGRYDAEALKQLNVFMGDWRRNESREMDPELIDLIWTLHKQLGSERAGQAHLGLPFGNHQQIAPPQGRRPGQRTASTSSARPPTSTSPTCR